MRNIAYGVGRTIGLVLCLAVSTAGAAEPLSQAKLREMAERGIDEALVLQLVRRDCVDFEVDADAVIALSESFSDDAISAMIECREATAAVAAVAPAAVVSSTAPVSFDDLEHDGIVVLPFAGQEAFRTKAAETLARGIAGLKKPQLNAVAPEELEAQGVSIATDPTAGGVALEEARRVAATVRAALAILGTIDVKDKSGTVVAATTLELLDVASGEIRGSSEGSCRLVMSKKSTCMNRAVERALADLTPALTSAAR